MTSIELILGLTNNDETLKKITQKALNSERISNEEGLYLFEHAELNYLGALANAINTKKHHNQVYFNKNFHIEPTNVCIYTCDFCSYSRSYKHREDGWELGIEEMMDIVRKYDGQDVTEVH